MLDKIKLSHYRDVIESLSYYLICVRYNNRIFLPMLKYCGFTIQHAK
jgi:hypothetical protein